MDGWLVKDIEINDKLSGVAWCSIVETRSAIHKAQRVSKMQSNIKPWNAGSVVVGIPTKEHKETALKLDEIIKGLSR